MGAAPKFKTQYQVPSDKPSFGRWIGIGLVVGGLLFLVLSISSPQKNHKESSPEKILKSAEYNKRVNEHLKMTAQEISQREQASRLESAKSDPDDFRKLGTTALPGRETDQDEIGADKKWDELAQRLNPDHGIDENSITQQLQSELLEKQNQRALTTAYKAEYARQFVENARKHGYQIELSSDYRVLSVKKIIKKDTPSLFDGQSESD